MSQFKTFVEFTTLRKFEPASCMLLERKKFVFLRCRCGKHPHIYIRGDLNRNRSRTAYRGKKDASFFGIPAGLSFWRSRMSVTFISDNIILQIVRIWSNTSRCSIACARHLRQM